MRIIVKTGTCEFDNTPQEELIIDGKSRQYVRSLSECPEDAIIGRGLVSCYDIVDYMREAWRAGVEGQDFAVVDEPMDNLH